jgi:hypothetical protein
MVTRRRSANIWPRGNVLGLMAEISSIEGTVGSDGDIRKWEDVLGGLSWRLVSRHRHFAKTTVSVVRSPLERSRSSVSPSCVEALLTWGWRPRSDSQNADPMLAKCRRNVSYAGERKLRLHRSLFRRSLFRRSLFPSFLPFLFSSFRPLAIEPIPERIGNADAGNRLRDFMESSFSLALRLPAIRAHFEELAAESLG